MGKVQPEQPKQSTSVANEHTTAILGPQFRILPQALCPSSSLRGFGLIKHLLGTGKLNHIPFGINVDKLSGHKLFRFFSCGMQENHSVFTLCLFISLCLY